MELNVTDTTGISPLVKEKQVSRRSKFLLTISTNFKPKTTAQSTTIASGLRNSLRQLLLRENIPNLISCLEGSCSDIESIDAEFNVELGKDPRGKRIHSHVILDVVHNCKVKLDLDFVRDFIPREINAFAREFIRSCNSL